MTRRLDPTPRPDVVGIDCTPAAPCARVEATDTTSTVNPASSHHIVRSSLLTALVAVFVIAGPAIAVPEKTAILPTSGSADTDSRARLDVALRKALNKESALVKLQAAKDTGGHLSSMAELGVICDNADVVCLQKLGIVAGVSRLLVVEASGKRTLDVSVTFINVDEGKVIRQTTGSVVVSEAEDTAELVKRVLNGEPAIAGILDATATPEPSDLDTPTAAVVVEGPIDETALNPQQFAGAVTAGIGGGVGVIGLLGALTSEAIFWTGTGPAATRRDVIAPLGSVMWIVTGVGIVAAAVGGVIFVTAAPTTVPVARLDAE